MLHEDGERSRGHGLPVALLEAQAEALGVPLVTGATTWDDYETTFVAVLHGLRRQGVEAGVFGDIDLEGHRVWVEQVCDVAELSCHLPLWHEPRRRLIDELLAGGVRATVVAVDAAKLDASFLGRELDASACRASSKQPAPMPAAKRVNTTRWSPPRRCSRRPSRWLGTAAKSATATGS